jgi:hypothetical protein
MEMTRTKMVYIMSMAMALMMSGCSQEKSSTQLSNAFKEKFTQGCIKTSSAAACACVLEKLEKTLSEADVQSVNSGHLNPMLKDKILAESKGCKK